MNAMPVFVWTLLEDWNGRARPIIRDGQTIWLKPIGIVHDEGKPRFVEAIELTAEQYEQDCCMYGLAPERT